MPIPLGILAAAGVVPAAGGSYELIETHVLSGSATSVEFANLSQYASTYEHLQIRIVSGQTGNNFNSLQFNSTTTGYTSHHLEATGSGSVSSANSITGNWQIQGASLGYYNSGAIHATVVDILDPYSTTKNKTIRALGGNSGSGANYVALTSGFWASTSAVSSIKILILFGDSFTSGSRFSIYGLKGQ